MESSSKNPPSVIPLLTVVLAVEYFVEVSPRRKWETPNQTSWSLRKVFIIKTVWTFYEEENITWISAEPSEDVLEVSEILHSLLKSALICKLGCGQLFSSKGETEAVARIDSSSVRPTFKSINMTAKRLLNHDNLDYLCRVFFCPELLRLHNSLAAAFQISPCPSILLKSGSVLTTFARSRTCRSWFGPWKADKLFATFFLVFVIVVLDF